MSHHVASYEFDRAAYGDYEMPCTQTVFDKCQEKFKDYDLPKFLLLPILSGKVISEMAVSAVFYIKGRIHLKAEVSSAIPFPRHLFKMIEGMLDSLCQRRAMLKDILFVISHVHVYGSNAIAEFDISKANIVNDILLALVAGEQQFVHAVVTDQNTYWYFVGDVDHIRNLKQAVGSVEVKICCDKLFIGSNGPNCFVSPMSDIPEDLRAVVLKNPKEKHHASWGPSKPLDISNAHEMLRVVCCGKEIHTRDNSLCWA